MSRMWEPTHIKATVIQARNLTEKKSKGNDVYVIISLGKEKFKTSIKEQTKNPVWNEECDLEIPESRKPLKFKLFHRSLSALGTDDFLGRAEILLNDIDVDAQPRPMWYKLENKSNARPSKKEVERGEIEILITFQVKSQAEKSKTLSINSSSRTLSSTSLNKSKKSGSLLSLSKKATSGSVKNLANIGNKIFSFGKKKDKKSNEILSVAPDNGSLNDFNIDENSPNLNESRKNIEKFNNLSPILNKGYVNDHNINEKVFEEEKKEFTNTRTYLKLDKDKSGIDFVDDKNENSFFGTNENETFSKRPECRVNKFISNTDNSSQTLIRETATTIIQATVDCQTVGIQSTIEKRDQETFFDNNDDHMYNIETVVPLSARGSLAKMVHLTNDLEKSSKFNYTTLSKEELICYIAERDNTIETYKKKVDDLCAKLMMANPNLLEVRNTRPVTRGHRVSTSLNGYDFFSR